MSEHAEREVKGTSVMWRDCCMRMCLPAVLSNGAVGPEHAVCNASYLINHWQCIVWGEM